MKVANFVKNHKKIKHTNIALIGHMGSGKSVIGKIIAKKLKKEYFESDKIIEKLTNKTITEIFKDDGEIIFREIEEKTIMNLKNKENIVLSLGGGSILSKKVRNLLKTDFITVFLDIDKSVLSKRLKNSKKRPLLVNVDIKNKIEELDLIRRKYYLLSNIIITEYENIEETLRIFLAEYTKIK